MRTFVGRLNAAVWRAFDCRWPVDLQNAMQWLVERVPLKPGADVAPLKPFRTIEPRTGSAE